MRFINPDTTKGNLIHEVRFTDASGSGGKNHLQAQTYHGIHPCDVREDERELIYDGFCHEQIPTAGRPNPGSTTQPAFIVSDL